MPENDLSLLIKMMKMTTATEDTVALVALRKANAHIKDKLGSDWESILTGKVTIIEDPFKNIDFGSAPVGTQRPARPPTPPPSPQPSWASPPPPRPRPQPFSRPQPGPQPAPPPPPTRGPTTINYCSLSNNAWGLRSNVPLKHGERVSVTKKNGKTKTEYVGNLIKHAFGDYIYDIGHNPAAPKIDLSQIF